MQIFSKLLKEKFELLKERGVKTRNTKRFRAWCQVVYHYLYYLLFAGSFDAVSLIFSVRILWKPSFANTFPLFEYFEDAPEGTASYDSKHG